MESPLVIRGKFTHQTFIPDQLLPEVEGPAELIVFVQPTQVLPEPLPSIFDFFGKAPVLLTAEDIDAQIHTDKQAWD
jgi:hypothetical protein